MAARNKLAGALSAALLVVVGGCTGDGPSEGTDTPCAKLKSDAGPTEVIERDLSDLPASSLLRDSRLPRVFLSAAAITAEATPLLEDPPGRVRMIAFWGEPGAHEPTVDTPLTFLGVDGRWRKLTRRDLGDDLGYLPSGERTLSPDGSRWIVGSRGWNKMLDFRTGKLVRLTRDTYTSAAWSPDSRTVAVWSMTKPGIKIFTRTGRRLADLPIDVKKRPVLLPNSRQIAIVDQVVDEPGPGLRLTTYDLDGAPVETTYCALPSGYPLRATGVRTYDGDRLWLSALVDRRRGVFRHSIIDTSTGTVIQDIENTGYLPYVDQWVAPGAYLAGILGAPDGIYAVDPDTGEMARISRIGLYADQEGYENHAHDQFARDLIFGSGLS